jgi:tetratricopeptide (TPR) repeat protein/predicted Ser/Thr protein kinase
MKHPGENTIVAFVEGRLPVSEAHALDAHIDTCEVCRSLVVAAARDSVPGRGAPGEAALVPAPPAQGTQLGRYTLLEVLGRGGMGVVYAAHDSALHRKVALKVLRGELAVRLGADLASARLLREARIAARLSHPNVVTIYDVGSDDGQVFIAMEHVDGQPLSTWLDAGPHPASAVLERFVQAGRGLAAAHAAGLVHRDFKPANVMVGTDGRVRVTDFGLAGWTEEPCTAKDASGEAGVPAQLHTVGPQGTPLYMAPEQHRGERAGPLADQFSFAVALYEALYRRRPFEGTTLEALAESKTRGLAEPPVSGGVPEHVRKAVHRALRPREEDRFPSMDALLAVLAPGEAAPWRRPRLVAGVLLLLVSGALGAFALGRGPSQVCAGGEQKLVGVWDAARRRAMTDAFVATGVPYAEDAAHRATAILDGYTRDWVAARRDACEATQVRKEQLAEHQALRMMCLDERLEQVRALGTFFARADRGIVERAVEAARGLTPLSGCADLRALSAKVPPPTDPAVRAKVEALGVKAAEARALHGAGRYKEAINVAGAARAEARATGYRPLEAQLALLQGEAEEMAGDYKGAEKTLREALLAAEAGRDDVTAARAWTTLVMVVGSRLSRFDEALTLAEHANAAIVRLGSAELERARLLAVRGGVLWSKADYPASLADAQEALALHSRLLPEDHPDLAQTLNEVATAASSLTRYAEAREHHLKALAIREKAFGPRHPKVAMTVYNLGLLLFLQQSASEAEPYFQRALDILEAASLGEHPAVARIHGVLSMLAYNRGEYARAIQSGERALAHAEKLHGPEHKDVGMILVQLGNAFADTGRLDESLRVLQRARAVFEKVLGPEHIGVSMAISALGRTHFLRKEYAAAVETYEQSIALRVKVLGPDHVSSAVDLDGLGEVLARQGRHAEALAAHQRALMLAEKTENAGGVDVPGLLLNIADVLVKLRRPAEALATAERALAGREQELGPEDPRLAHALRAVGVAAFHAGRQEAARAALERAVRLKETADTREAHATAREYLARASGGRKAGHASSAR